MKRLSLLVLLAVALGACNTMQGIGKDIKKTGEAIENAGRK